MASQEAIASLAMTLLKRPPITSINDSTIEAESVLAVWDMLLEELLEQYAWTFAITRVQLQQTAVVPAYQYDFEYPIPADCMMPLEARADLWTQCELLWIAEGQNILTNADVVCLKYSARVTDTGLFTPTFAMAMAHKIAATLAYPMTGKEGLTESYIKSADAIAAKAQHRDAQKGSQEQFQRDDSWVKARNSSRLIYDRELGWLNQGQTI